MTLQLNVKINNGYVIPINIEQSGKHLQIKFRYHPVIVEEIKSWKGASWDPELKIWMVDDCERNWYCIEMLEKGFDALYDSDLKIIEEFDRPLLKQQKIMTSGILQRKRVIIAGDMGVGKTLSAIEAIEKIKLFAWVICPASAKLVWRDEIAKWKSNIKIHLISYEKLSTVVSTVPVNEFPNIVIFDEAHKLKNPQSKRAEAALLLSEVVRNNGGYIIPMSGTPSPHDPSDWWMLCELCQPGWLREGSKRKLAYRLGEFETNVSLAGAKYKSLIKWKQNEVEKLYRRIGNMAIIVKKKDCLDLPPKVYKEHKLVYTAKDKQLVNKLIALEGKGIQALSKLRQFSDGFQYHSICTDCFGERQHCNTCHGSGEIIQQILTPKDQAIIDYLQDDRTRIVIWAAYTATIDKLVQLAKDNGWITIRMDGRGIDSELENPLQQFQSESQTKIAFIGHPRSGGISITLTASDLAIFYSNDFDAASRPQAEDRIYRIGTVSATIVDLLWLPTDKYVLDNLKLKKSLQAVTLGEIQEICQQENKFYDVED